MRWLLLCGALLPIGAHGDEPAIIGQLSRCGWLYMQAGSCAAHTEGEQVADQLFHRAFAVIQKRNNIADRLGVSKARRAVIDNGISEASPIEPCPANSFSGMAAAARQCDLDAEKME
jgi:hypothetical protein